MSTTTLTRMPKVQVEVQDTDIDVELDKLIEKVRAGVDLSSTEMAPMPTKRSENRFTLTPQYARDLLKKNDFKNQRDVGKARLHELTEKIHDGRFRVGYIDIGVMPDGREYLVNGQQSCISILAANKSSDGILTIWDCLDEVELVTLWNQYDTGGVRSNSAMAKSYTSIFGDRWTKNSISLLAASIAAAEKGVSFRSLGFATPSKEGRILLLKHNQRVASIARDVIFGEDGDTKCKHMARVPVAAVILKSAELDEADTREFWGAVNTGLGFTGPNDPAYRVREYLMDAKTSPSAKKTVNKLDSQETMMAKCAFAWNCFRRGDEMKGKKGIPYNGTGIPDMI